MKLGVKLFIGFICMAALTVGLLWLIQAGIMKNSYENERVQTIREGLIRASGESSIDFASLEETLNARFLLLDESGNTIYVSQGMPMMGRMARMMEMMPEADGSLQMLNGMNGSVQYAVIGYPIGTDGTVYAVFSLADVQEAARLLQEQLWLITAALVVFAVVIAVMLAGKFSRPIRGLTGAARALASGRLDISLPVRSRDEIGQLTGALNDLGRQLKATENLRRELIANVSHELRSPLSVIRGYAETVRDVTWPNESKRTEQLTIIAEEAARLDTMVGAILDYSRLQAGAEKPELSDFLILPVLEKIVRLHELAASGRDLRIKLVCPDILVRFDRNRFEQVVHNLLSNAVGYAKSGTEIVIQAEKKDTAARISVKNAGDPIPPGEIENIWDRYYRGSGAQTGRQSGTGFGLAIVKSIVDQHKTACGVHSVPEETVFWFETQKTERHSPSSVPPTS